MLNVVDDRDKINIFLDKLLTLHNVEQKKSMNGSVCTGAAVSAAYQLL